MKGPLVLIGCLILGACAGREEKVAHPSQESPVVAGKRPAWRVWEAIIPPRPVLRAAQALVEVGEIKLVDRAEGFVLIDASRRSLLSPGAVLVVIEQGVQVAALRMTDLQAPPFVIADVVEGDPEAGQRVHFYQ